MVSCICCGEYQTNCYLYHENGKLLVIDPGDDASSIINEITNIDIKPSAIILTHGHFDHIASVDSLVDEYDIPVYIHPEDSHYFKLPDFNLSMYYYKQVILKTNPILLHTNDISIDGIDIKIVETPGHTQGGVCFYINGQIFSGDTIFFENIGRTDFPSGKHQLLLRSIKRLLETFSDDTTIYPGHGPETTVGHEKLNNPHYNTIT